MRVLVVLALLAMGIVLSLPVMAEEWKGVVDNGNITVTFMSSTMEPMNDPRYMYYDGSNKVDWLINLAWTDDKGFSAVVLGRPNDLTFDVAKMNATKEVEGSLIIKGCEKVVRIVNFTVNTTAGPRTGKLGFGDPGIDMSDGTHPIIVYGFASITNKDALSICLVDDGLKSLSAISKMTDEDLMFVCTQDMKLRPLFSIRVGPSKGNPNALLFLYATIFFIYFVILYNIITCNIEIKYQRV